MLGPKAQQLKQYVDAADEGALHAAGEQWAKGERLLRQVASQLEQRGRSFGTDERFSGDTADAASQAFQHSSKKMQDRADQMHQGSQAFHGAAQGVSQARKVSNQLDAHAGDQPPTEPPDKSDAKAQSHYQTQKQNFWAQYADSETSAGHAITALSQNHTHQAQVFQSIHGEAPPPAPSGGGGGRTTGGGATPPPATRLPGMGPVRHTAVGGPTVPHQGPATTTLPGPHGPHGGDGGPNEGPSSGPGGAPGVHVTGPHGVPAGPGAVTGPGAVPGALGGGTALGGSGVGAIGGAGALAGGALGGAAAAGLAGGLNGGLGGLNEMVPLGGGSGSLSVNGVRGIGSSARTGAGSVLGRGGAAGRAGAGGTAGRSAGRSGRGASGRGAAGSRRTRAGAGAGSGRGGKDRKGQGEDRDLFDDGAEWLDDEEAAPGVLD